MKSPLRKLKGFANHHHHKNEGKDNKKDHRRNDRFPAKLDELVQATQDMVDMRSCYDSLLSAAAATANSAYEFSEALEEMASCLLEKTALNEDEDSGRVMIMLGKVQFELHKLVDSYRGHITQTITKPSESLLKELQIVEEMKQQCDERRESYKFALAAYREKGRSKYSKGESISSQQLQEARDAYEEEADLFIFRLKSLKQGQSRSLLTQSARHHAAQLNLFRKGLKALEGVEPHVKEIADREHIDYQFSGLEDDDSEDDCDDSYTDNNDDGELSFDYGSNDRNQNRHSSYRNSMELDQVDLPATQASKLDSAQEHTGRKSPESFHFRRPSAGSQSAPIFLNKKLEPSEKVLQPSSSKKFHTYALPTPVDAKRSVSADSVNPVSIPKMSKPTHTQSWHSSPLEPHQFPTNTKTTEAPRSRSPIQKENSRNTTPNKKLPPLNEEPMLPHFNSSAKKVRRYAFSGPISTEDWSENPISSRGPARVVTSRSPISPRTSNISPPPVRSPVICELHELPRPPNGLVRSTRPASLIGHSAPLVYNGPDSKKSNRVSPVSSQKASPQKASPLPTPPNVVQRSYSIPSRRLPVSPVDEFLDDPRNAEFGGDFASPPLTPISLRSRHSASEDIDRVLPATKAKGSS